MLALCRTAAVDPKLSSAALNLKGSEAWEAVLHSIRANGLDPPERCVPAQQVDLSTHEIAASGPCVCHSKLYRCQIIETKLLQ
jgi:hypothetical protein